MENEVVGEQIGVLGVGGEAVIGAVEGELEEADGGRRRNGGFEFLDVERGVEEDYVVALFLSFQG